MSRTRAQGRRATHGGARLLGLAIAALLAAPGAWPSAADLAAQRAAPRAGAPSPPGWVGFWYEVVAGPEQRAWLVVDRVQEGSPAETAGLAAGDTLLAVDGTALSPALFRAIGQGLRAGDAVRLTVRRDGRRHEMEVVAAPRPPGLAATLELMPAPAPPRARRARVPSPALPAPSARVLVEPALPDVGSARSFHVFVWSAADSLLDRLSILEEEEREARAAEARRLRELAAAVGAGRRVNAEDPVLMAHRAHLEAVRTETAALKRRIDAAARARAREAAAPSPLPGFRPLTPYLVGRDRAAGAQLTPLNEGLAPYFGARRGLLVVEVADGTPAHEAGLLPGDVLLSAAGTPLATLADLRAVLSAASARPVPLSVLRNGRAFDARLP